MIMKSITVYGQDGRRRSRAQRHGIHRLITRKFGEKIFVQTLRQFVRQKLHWVVVRTKTGPVISDKNKVKKMDFAKKYIAATDSFDDVIWSDES